MLRFIRNLWLEYKNEKTPPSTKLSIISSVVTLLGINALLAFQHYPFLGKLLITLPILLSYGFLVAVNLNNYRLYKNKKNIVSNITESLFLILVLYPIILLIKYLLF
jgi:hypothetical protein